MTLTTQDAIPGYNCDYDSDALPSITWVNQEEIDRLMLSRRSLERYEDLGSNISGLKDSNTGQIFALLQEDPSVLEEAISE